MSCSCPLADSETILVKIQGMPSRQILARPPPSDSCSAAEALSLSGGGSCQWAVGTFRLTRSRASQISASLWAL